MTHPVDPAVERAHADVVSLFRDHTDGDAAVTAAGLAAVCRAARDRLALLPSLDPHDPRTWSSYELITADVRTLLGYLHEAGVPSSESERFRSLLIRVLHYLYRADDGAEPGILLAELLHRDWAARIGESHADTIEAAERLAACLHAQGDSQRARPLFEKVLLLRSKKLGDADPATLVAACNMGSCLNQLRDYRAAFRLNDDTVRRCERRLGKDNGTTILATGNLASSLFWLGEHRRALSLYRAVHQWHQRASGVDALDTLWAEADVAVTLSALAEHEAARVVNAGLLPRFERAAGKDYSGTRHTRDRLVRNLRALGRDEEADEVHGGIPRF